jgi:hypothetical protein
VPQVEIPHDKPIAASYELLVSHTEFWYRCAQ